MNGLDDQAEPRFIVPQNSISNMPHKMGLTEQPYNVHHSPTIHMTKTMTHTTSTRAVPIEKTFSEVKTPTVKCANCENMAKNFLYLESLIRSNYNSRYNCSLCYSSLKYLQYVNKNIMQIFGSFDSIVQAARAFGTPHKRAFLPPKGGSPLMVRKQKGKHNAAVPAAAAAKKTNLTEKMSAPDLARIAGGAERSAKVLAPRFSTQGNTRRLRAKIAKKKSKTSKRAPKMARLAGGANDSAKVLASRISTQGSTKRLRTKIAKKKASRHIMGRKGDITKKKPSRNVANNVSNKKPKKIKPKRNKLALVRVLGSRCYHHAHA